MSVLQFTLQDLRSVVLFCIVCTAIAATIFYKKYNTTFLKYFLILIWYNVVNEFVAPLYSDNISYNNVVLYNVYRVVEFSFYLLLYYNLVNNKTLKKIILGFLIFYYISVIVNCFYQNFQYDYFSNTYFVGATLILISIILYFSEILNSEKIVLVNRMFAFWISIAAFLYFVTSIPFKLIINFYEESATIPYIYISNYALGFIFYLILLIGLLWSKEKSI